jgi:hypothetical protein
MKTPTASLFALCLISAAALSQSLAHLGPGRKFTSVERLGVDHLRTVHSARAHFASMRSAVRLSTGYTDYRAVMHAHAQDAAHTGGTRPQLLAAAKLRRVQIVMLTDHVRPERDFINDSWRGIHDGVLFIPGAEDRGFLSFPLHSIKGQDLSKREDYVLAIREGGGNIFLSHVEERLDWPTDQLDGLEIYNHHTDVKDEVEFNFWLQGALTDPDRLSQLVSALKEFPEEVFGAQQDYLSEILKKWDHDSQKHHLTGVAANDCHHNQVLTITAVDEKTVEIGYIGSKPATKTITADQAPKVRQLVKGKRPGDLIARLDFDPYERSLNYVSTHILAHQLSEAAVRDALRRGHAYVSHDWLCDPTGFAFVADIDGDGVEVRPTGSAGAASKHFQTSEPAIMGDEVDLKANLVLKVATPLTCTLRLIRNGQIVRDENAGALEFRVDSPGVYRVEAWLVLDGEMRPWIYSNPIYVR